MVKKVKDHVNIPTKKDDDSWLATLVMTIAMLLPVISIAYIILNLSQGLPARVGCTRNGSYT